MKKKDKSRRLQIKESIWTRKDAEKMAAFFVKYRIHKATLAKYLNMNRAIISAALQYNPKVFSLQQAKMLKDLLNDPSSFLLFCEENKLFFTEKEKKKSIPREEKKKIWTEEDAEAMRVFLAEYGLSQESLVKYMKIKKQTVSAALRHKLRDFSVRQAKALKEILNNPSSFLSFCKKNNLHFKRNRPQTAVKQSVKKNEEKQEEWSEEDARNLRAFLAKYNDIKREHISKFFLSLGIGFRDDITSKLARRFALKAVPSRVFHNVRMHLKDPENFARQCRKVAASNREKSERLMTKRQEIKAQKTAIWTEEKKEKIQKLMKKEGASIQNLSDYLGTSASPCLAFLYGCMGALSLEKIQKMVKILDDPSEFIDSFKEKKQKRTEEKGKIWKKEDSERLFSFLDENGFSRNQFCRFLQSLGFNVIAATFSKLRPNIYDLKFVPVSVIQEIKKQMEDPESLAKKVALFKKQRVAPPCMPTPPAQRDKKAFPPRLSRGQIVIYQDGERKKKYIVVSDGWEERKEDWVISLFPCHTDEQNKVSLCVRFPYLGDTEEITLFQDVQVKDMEQVLANQQAERDERLRDREQQAQNAGRFIKVGDTLYKKASEEQGQEQGQEQRQEQGQEQRQEQGQEQRQEQDIAAKRLTQSIKKEIENFKAEQFFAMRSLTNLVGDLLGRVAELEKRLGVKGE